MFRELARNHRVNMYCVWPRTDETSSKIRFSKIEPPHICKPINCVWFVFSWPALPSSQCRLCWPQSKSQTKFNDVQDNFSCDIIALWLDKVSPDWETEFLLVQDAGFKWNTLPRADKGNRNPWGLPQTYSGRCLEIRLVDIAMDFCKSHGRHMSSTRKAPHFELNAGNATAVSVQWPPWWNLYICHYVDVFWAQQVLFANRKGHHALTGQTRSEINSVWSCL